MIILVSQAEVVSLANSYRRTLATGDAQLPKSPLEVGILRALVAASADDNASWIRRAVPNGNTIVEPLDQLLPYLKKGDFVGQTLSAARKVLLREAKHLIRNQAFSQSMVFVWVTFSSLLGLILQGAATAGDATGRTVYWLFFTGVIAVGPLTRFIFLSWQTTRQSNAPEAVASGVSKFLAYPTRVGERAFGVFDQAIGDWLRKIHAPDAELRKSKLLIIQARAWAGLIVYGTAALAVVTLGLFLVSAATSFTEERTKPLIPRDECSQIVRPDHCPARTITPLRRPTPTYPTPRPTLTYGR
ncbi:hypothetical protein [Nocardia sp. NPDC060249]|uniref:hypothetical protein n=1 Tax=Nocardia sp. NPDC060249 TaxID=3347082 RepID=UPI00364DC882